MLLLISEASMVCVTLDVTGATPTTAPVMATSILLWAFISSLARLRRVEEASPGDPGRFLLSSMVPIVTGEISGPILHCGRCHTLDTRALDDLMCSLPDIVLRKTSEARANRRRRRYYLIVLLLPNIFTLACLPLSSI